MDFRDAAAISGTATGSYVQDNAQPISAPNVIPSHRREAPELWMFFSGGGSWSFYHYGLIKRTLTNMLDPSHAFANARIGITVGTSGGSIPVYVLGNTLNGKGSREENILDALEAMENFKRFFTMAVFYPDMWLALMRGNHEHSLRRAIDAAGTRQPDSYDNTRTLAGTTYLAPDGTMTPRHLIDAQVTRDAVIASCSVPKLFPGVPTTRFPSLNLREGRLIDGGNTENPPTMSALKSLGIDRPGKNTKTIVSLVECPLSPGYGENSLLGEGVPTGRQIAREFVALRRFVGRENVEVCAMFSKFAQRPAVMTEHTKALTAPWLIEACYQAGVESAAALAEKFTGFLAPADKCAPA